MQDIVETKEKERHRASWLITTIVGHGGAGTIGPNRTPVYCQNQIDAERTRVEKLRPRTKRDSTSFTLDDAITTWVDAQAGTTVYNRIVDAVMAYRRATSSGHSSVDRKADERSYNQLVDLVTGALESGINQDLQAQLDRLAQSVGLTLEPDTANWRPKVASGVRSIIADLQNKTDIETLKEHLYESGLPAIGSEPTNPPAKQLEALLSEAQRQLAILGEVDTVTSELLATAHTTALDHLNSLETVLGERVRDAADRYGLHPEEIHTNLDRDWAIAEDITDRQERAQTIEQ